MREEQISSKLTFVDSSISSSIIPFSVTCFCDISQTCRICSGLESETDALEAPAPTGPGEDCQYQMSVTGSWDPGL